MQIEVKHPTVEETFAQSFYEIPAFQREYVWREEQVESLLSDAWEALFDENGKPSESGEYFIGSIVAYQDGNGIFQLIDGQQRLTTLFVILCVLRDLRAELLDPDATSMALLNSLIRHAAEDMNGNTRIKLRLKPLYPEAGDLLDQFAAGTAPVNAKRPHLPNSARNLLDAYETTRAFLRQQQLDTDLTVLRRFQANFIKRVRLVRIQTLGISDALRIFETVNDRGVGLNSLDLLKNLLFMHVDKNDFDKLTQIWKEMVHTIEKTGTGRGEKPLRFLRYFMLANYANARKNNKPLTEDDLYEWLSAHKKNIGVEADALGFARQLLEAAQAYSRFVSRPDYALSNIYALSARARQHLVVLLACKDLDDIALQVVTFQLERLFVAYVLSQEPTKRLDQIFADAATNLKAWLALHSSKDAAFNKMLAEHLAQWVEPEIVRLRPRVLAALDRLAQDRKATCHFVLRRVAQHLEGVASTPLASTAYAHFAKFEIEHVLPQSPTSEQRAAFDRVADYDEYCKRMGNLALLEKSINAALGRDYFEQKKPEFNRSGLFLTRSLAAYQGVGLAGATVRAARSLTVHDSWSSQAIETRQKELVQLASEIWGLA